MRATVILLIAALTAGARPHPITRTCTLCTCAPPSPNTTRRAALRAALRKADVVLRARVLAVDALPTDAGTAWVSAWPEGRRVRLHVLRVWKGHLRDSAEVFTGFGFGDCGYPFERDAEYLIFARRLSNGRLVTAVCTGTGLASEAASDLADLGRGRPPL